MRITPYEHIYNNTATQQPIQTPQKSSSNNTNAISNLLGNKNNLSMLTKLLPLIGNNSQKQNSNDVNTQNTSNSQNASFPSNNTQFLLDKFLSQMAGNNTNKQNENFSQQNNAQTQNSNKQPYVDNYQPANYNKFNTTDESHIETQRVTFENAKSSSLNNNRQTLINQMNLHQRMLNRLNNWLS